ncbi:Isocitrate/isopropylmalate dehydrogenase-domain-containing protein [Cladorrhinum sp. PSN259]|nr:Isocitrate/isopropylmalate dehydrogenase-domain-containing protein [Cladorrhinum sp. PSN259]
MSGEQEASSFGDSNAQPPTPKQTPTSAIFPSPIFETPKTNSGRFDESNGWTTPRFAEEYSVFNSTPGNLLKGTHSPFPNFAPGALLTFGSTPKRPLSTEEVTNSTPANTNPFSPNPSFQLPSVEPSKVLGSSPTQLPTPTFDPLVSERSGKKARRGTVTKETTQGQTATPPPSAHKGQRKLAPKPESSAMQNDQGYGQPDFMANAQQQNMGSFVTSQNDMFGYPLSAPATAQSFWDPNPGDMVGMDVDFGTNGGNVFQNQNGTHQPMSPAEWAQANQMPLISQAPMPPLVTSAPDQGIFAVHYRTTMEDPFGISGNTGGGVDPGLLFSRPPSANMDAAPLHQSMQTPTVTSSHSIAGQGTQPNGRAAPPAQKGPSRTEQRRSSSTRNSGSSKNDRASASSPIKPSGRPGLSRSFSESRGKKATGRQTLPALAPAPRPQSQLVNNAGVNANRPIVSQPQRPSGRSSPLKSNPHHRLSSLSSIPESSGPRMRTQAKFTIDANGRARVETTVIVEDDTLPSARKRHASHSVRRRQHWASSEDDDSSSTDDEPIIITSRNTSFAIPDPVKPAGIHPFHNPNRSISERSTTSSSYASFRKGGPLNDGADSDLETVVDKDMTTTGNNLKTEGDALAEVQKLRETRRGHQWSASKPRLNTSFSNSMYASNNNPNGNNLASSPTTATESLPTPTTGSRTNRRVRCTCTRTEAGRGEFTLQCRSCEMWVHGRCVGITEVTQPTLYICSYCGNTPARAAGRFRGEIMATHNIVVFGGDHCGPEVLKAIEANSPSAGKFNLQDHLLGGASIDAHNSALTDEALAAAKAADAVLLGAIGGPEWGPSSPVRPEQGILKLRKELGTYGNLRPCSFASESLVDSSPLKAEVCRGTDFVVVRELTGGIYFGDRKEDDGSGFAMDTEPYSRPEIERIARLAGFLALAKNPPAKVWSLDKANVLATSRLWRKVVNEVFAAEFPQLELNHQLIDSAAMLMIKNPRALNGIVMTSNLFGDIISDEASVIPGSIGLLPSASLGGIPDGKGKCNGIYEPIHGSAPDISGKGIVNPIGTILSVAMMLQYSLNLPKEAAAVEAAVKLAIDSGVRSKDLGGSATTKEVGDAVVAELVKLLKA